MKLSGFSLLELSIVLVIIGLLSGGVMVGQDLIKQAGLRAIINEYNQISTATNAFRSKYNALPGDMRNATAYWMKDSTACNSDTGTAGSPGTCNGNNDGLLTYTSNNNTAEVFQFWRHLALAGLLEGSYTGLTGPSSATHHQFGVNSPTSKYDGGGWASAFYDNRGNIYSANFTVDYRKFFTLSGVIVTHPNERLLNVEDAYGIDLKIDDGLPARGIVHTSNWCTTAAGNRTDLNATYLLDGTAVYNTCPLNFRNSNIP